MSGNNNDMAVLSVVKFVVISFWVICLGLAAVLFISKHWDEKCKMHGGVPATFGGNSVCMTKDGRFMADPK